MPLATIEIDSSDGVRIARHDLGGSGPPLLICHATGFCGLAYTPFAAELTERFHLWTFDYRGHGYSSSPANERLEWPAFAEDLIAVSASIADEPMLVMGHSLGGGTAVLAELARPGLLERAYFFEPIIQPPASPMAGQPNFMAENARRRRPSFPTKGDAMMRYASRPPLGELRADALAAYVEHGFDDGEGVAALRCTPEHEAACFEGTGKPTFIEAAKVEAPCVIGVGRTEDGFFSPSMFGPGIADAMPNATLEQLPSIGHFGPLQDPSGVAARVAAALAS